MKKIFIVKATERLGRAEAQSAALGIIENTRFPHAVYGHTLYDHDTGHVIETTFYKPRPFRRRRFNRLYPMMRDVYIFAEHRRTAG
jgi:hypothetical protein